MANREFLITAAPLIDFNGSTNIPTQLYYQASGRPLVGHAARSAAIHEPHALTEDFKLELGNSDPSTRTKPRRRFQTSRSFTKTSAELTSDFLDEILKRTTTWLTEQGFATTPNVLLAEPLAMQAGLVEASWLSNYRRNLSRILAGRFSNIDFLPEPFAVFQYYRHGLRHPLVAERHSHNALVIDFGGGTFDVCVISTTSEGDISQSGRNSRPLAAASLPVGGFSVNRLIAEQIYRKQFGAYKTKYKRGVEAYHRWMKGRDGRELDSMHPEVRNFVLNLYKTSHLVEDLKLTLCRNIRHWTLEGNLSLSAPLSIPADPFGDGDETRDIRYTAAEFKALFEDSVWKQQIRNVVAQAIKRAHQDLQGAPISIVLLSGGSANIGWLRSLIERDFPMELEHAEILSLTDYQEVVAKGLAVECARRFFSKEGDFGAVTYNKLCLILAPDQEGKQLVRYKARTDGLQKVLDSPGVLLPSASIVRRFIGKPMVWRFKLQRPPHKTMEYYFLRSSFDPNDLENRQNVEHTVLHTPKKCAFDKDLKLHLTVQADGTAESRFVYKSGRSEDETVAVEGRPFFLDMTFGGNVGAGPKAWIGLDFGSSNSSLSFVTEESIQIYKNRSSSEKWRGLSELTSSLPYPLAEPLARYVGQTDPDKLANAGREFLEAALAFAAYVSLCDRPKGLGSKHFKSLTQRSLGPLWSLIRRVLDKQEKGKVMAGFARLLEAETFERVNEAVTFFGKYKHDKATSSSFDFLRIVQLVANISQAALAGWVFGMFEHVQLPAFSKEYAGRFRQASGTPPFVRLWEYRGSESFSEDQAFLIRAEDRLALPLQPFVFWDRCSNHIDLEYGHCYLFDRAERSDDECLFKAVGHTCTIDAGMEERYSAIAGNVKEWRAEDRSGGRVEIEYFKPFNEESS